jgi:hypothetical protein
LTPGLTGRSAADVCPSSGHASSDPRRLGIDDDDRQVVVEAHIVIPVGPSRQVRNERIQEGFGRERDRPFD